MEILMEYLAKGFIVMLMVALPCVLVAAGIGLVVGILQAVTQVQEQTIAAAPKILFVFLTIIILGGWYVKVLTDFLVEGANIAFNVVPRNDTYVLPADYYKHTRPFMVEFQKGPEKADMTINKTIPESSFNKVNKAPDRKTGVIDSKGPNFMERMKMRNK